MTPVHVRTNLIHIQPITKLSLAAESTHICFALDARLMIVSSL